VADLLDVQLAALVEGEQRVEQVEHRAVVDRQRPGALLLPAGVRPAALQERVAVGVEEAAAVGGQAQRVVLDARVHGAEEREDAVPGGGRALQRIFAVAVGTLLDLRAQPGGRERLGVQRGVDRQQLALLGDEQEDEAHHHRPRAAIDFGGLQLGEQLPVAFAVLAVEGGDEQLDGVAHLRFELVGDLLLPVGALLKQLSEAVFDGEREEAPGAEQRRERTQGQRLFQPQLRTPGAGAGRLVRARPDQRPSGAVGDQDQRRAGRLGQLGGSVDRAGRPRLAGDRAIQPRALRVGAYE